MVSKKKSTKPPRSRHSTHPPTNPPVTQSSSIILSSFSPSYLRLSLFASTILGLDSQQLRVHDTLTGKLRCEYAFDKGAACNSLAWGTLSTEGHDGGGKSKKQKKRKRPSSTDGGDIESDSIAILALGMNKGSILLYSPTEGALMGSLDGGHIGEVTCFKFARKSSKGWSCGTDGKLVEWDLKRKTPLRYCQPLARLCLNPLLTSSCLMKQCYTSPRLFNSDTCTCTSSGPLRLSHCVLYKPRYTRRPPKIRSKCNSGAWPSCLFRC